MDLNKIFNDLGVKQTNKSSAIGSEWFDGVRPKIISNSPVNGEEIGSTQFLQGKNMKNNFFM